MQVRRQVSPLLTLVLLLGAFVVFRQSPWIRESQGWSAHPLAEPATSAENVATLTPMIPPGFQAPVRASGQHQAVATSARSAPLVEPYSSLQLANPRVAQSAHLAPERREQINQTVSRLNAQTEQVMRQAIQRWRQQGGFTSRQMPDFQSATSPHRREIEQLTRKAEREIAQLLTDEELSRWKAMRAPAEPIRPKPLFPALVD